MEDARNAILNDNFNDFYNEVMLKIINYDNKDFYVVDKELRDSLTTQEKEDIKELYIKLPFSAKNFISVEDYEEIINPTELITNLVILDAKEYKKQEEEVVIENKESEDYIAINDIPEEEDKGFEFLPEKQAKKFAKYMSKLKDKNADKLVDNYEKYRCHKTTLSIEGFTIPVILYNVDVKKQVQKELAELFPNEKIAIGRNEFPSGMVVFDTLRSTEKFRKQLLEAVNYYKGLE